MMSKDWYPPFSMWRILFCFVDKYSLSITQLRMLNSTNFCSLAITLAGFFSCALFDELEQEIHQIIFFLA